MRSRLPIALLAVIAATAVLVAGFGLNLRARTAIGTGDDLITPSPGTMTFTKTADEAEVHAGGQIGFSLELLVEDTQSIVWYIEDDLPSGPGIHWTVDSFTGAASCTIASNAPQHLECVGNGGTGATHIIVHVTSPTTIDSPALYLNSARAGYPGFTDLIANEALRVLASTPTSSPTVSPTATPVPSVPAVWGGGNAITNAVLIFNKIAGTVRLIMFDVHRNDPCVMSVAGTGGDTETVDIEAPLTNGHFDTTVGSQRVQGDVTDGDAPFAEGDVTIEIGNECENTEHFDAEPAGQALLQGDIDCSWADLYAAGTSTLPQGPTPAPTPLSYPAKGITVGDVVDVFKWVAGFEEDSPIHCPKISDLIGPAPSATAVPGNPHVWGSGDVDCSMHDALSEAEAQEFALKILIELAGLDQPSPGCVKVGKFFLSDR